MRYTHGILYYWRKKLDKTKQSLVKHNCDPPKQGWKKCLFPGKPRGGTRIIFWRGCAAHGLKPLPTCISKDFLPQKRLIWWFCFEIFANWYPFLRVSYRKDGQFYNFFCNFCEMGPSSNFLGFFWPKWDPCLRIFFQACGYTWVASRLLGFVWNSYTPLTLHACCSQSKFRILKLRESSAHALFLYNCTPNIWRELTRAWALRMVDLRERRVDLFSKRVTTFCW